jgi:hypothetical protein
MDAKVNPLLESHWDFADLLTRLQPHHSDQDKGTADLRREAAGAIRSLLEANKQLHRRAQKEEGFLERQLGRARRHEGWSREWASSSFSRMLHAHDEIKLIYEEIRRARDDGCDSYGYHSVMDSRCDGGDTPPGTVWANKFKSKTGGIVSVRPAEVIGALIDELIAFRKFFGSPPKG